MLTKSIENPTDVVQPATIAGSYRPLMLLCISPSALLVFSTKII